MFFIVKQILQSVYLPMKNNNYKKKKKIQIIKAYKYLIKKLLHCSIRAGLMLGK